MSKNVKQSVIITAIGMDVRAKLQTTWDEDGRWFERGKEMFGAVERQVTRAMNFNSVVQAQNFADEIGAAFLNPVTGVLDVGARHRGRSERKGGDHALCCACRKSWVGKWPANMTDYLT